MSLSAPPVAHRRMLRRRTGTVVAGVAGGLADHLGADPARVRLVLAALCAFSGSGVLAYVALWVSCPLERVGRPRATSSRERWQAVAAGAVGAVLLVVLLPLDGGLLSWVAGPLGVVLLGAALVWREAGPAGGAVTRPGRPGRSTLLPSVPGERVGPLRVAAGAVLVAVGIVAFLLGNLDVGQLQFGLLAALATLVGVLLLTVPWWLRLARDLSTERRARIRDQERAEIAAHLHDSVLQTLALIQKQSGDDDPGREVRRLARRQERELRSWLYARADRTAEHAGEPDAETPRTVAAAIAAVAAEVEDDHGVRVAPVVVGDAEMDPEAEALVAAAREAMVNAAKHSGAAEISVFVEAEPEQVAVFVRDRGVGFDPEAVPADRHGLAGSVHARMARHGGRVRLRTTIGEGTEVGLTMPRDRAASRATTEGER